MANDNSLNDGVIEHLLRLSGTDADFRARLLNDPRSAADEIAPGAIPTRAQIRFIESPRGVERLYVLPAFASRATADDDDIVDELAGCADTGEDVCENPYRTCPWVSCGPVTCSYTLPPAEP